MNWLGLILIAVVLTVVIFVFSRQIYRQILDPTWSPEKNLPPPPWSGLISGVACISLRTLCLIVSLFGFFALIGGLFIASQWAYAVADVEPGEVQYAFWTELDASFTRDFYPLFNDVLHPAVNFTAHISETVLPIANLYGGSIHLVNRRVSEAVFRCELADKEQTAISLVGTWAEFAQSLLYFIYDMFQADPQLFDWEGPVLQLQAAYDAIDGTLTCACEVLEPLWRLVNAAITPPGLAVFAKGALNLWPAPLAPSLDFLSFLIDLFSRIFQIIFDFATGSTFLEVLRDSWFLDLTHEPKFRLTAEASECVSIGAFSWLNDFVLGAIRAFYPPLETEELPDFLSPLGHLGAAWVQWVRLLADVVFHFGQAGNGFYNGHIQAGFDPIGAHVATAAELWRNQTGGNFTSLVDNGLCILAGLTDGALGGWELTARLVVGLVRSGREPPLPTVVTYTRDNATSYADFLRGPIVRASLERSKRGWEEAGLCVGPFLEELDPPTADAWYEILHLFNATFQSVIFLADQFPLYDGTSGYFNSGDVSEFQQKLKETFQEARYMARAFGNFWARRASPAQTYYTQTEYGTADTTATRTNVFETSRTGATFATRTRTRETTRTLTETYSLNNGGVIGTRSLSTYYNTYTRSSVGTFFGNTYSATASAGESNTIEFGLFTATESFQRVAVARTTTSETYLGTRLLSSQDTATDTEVYATTITETQTGAYEACPSWTPPHGAYYNDTIYREYPGKGIPYGFCCFGRFVERFMLLYISAYEMAVDTAVHIAAKEYPTDSPVESLATNFCPGGPADFTKEFLPIASVMLDDAGCTIAGMIRGSMELAGKEAFDYRCANSQDFIYTKVIKFIVGAVFFQIKFFLNLAAFALQTSSVFFSTVGGVSEVQGGCPLSAEPSIYVDTCQLHLVEPLRVQQLCDSLVQLYGITIGEGVEVAAEGLEIFTCSIDGFDPQGFRSLLAYLGRGGGVEDVICRIVNALGSAVSWLKMIFTGPFVTRPLLGQDVDQKGFLNYMWCKLTAWFPFFDAFVDIVQYVKDVIAGIQCIIQKLSDLADNLWGCVQSIIHWKKNCCEESELAFSAGCLAKMGCNCPAGIFQAGFSSCIFPTLKRATNDTNVTVDLYEECRSYGNSTLELEHYVDCVWSSTYAAAADMFLLNEEFPRKRLVPPRSFYSVREFGSLAVRIGAAFPAIWGEAMEFVFSDADPYERERSNCSTVFNESSADEALEHRLCVLGVGVARTLREMAARGDDTFWGAIVNVIGEVVHLSSPFDLQEHLFAKADGAGERRSSAWQSRLARLDSRRAVTEIKRAAPPLAKREVARAVMGREVKALEWGHSELLKAFKIDSAGPPREIPWRPVYDHFRVALENKRAAMTPGYRSKALDVPTIEFPSDLLCPSVGDPGLDDPAFISDLRCTQRNPMWDAFGNPVGDCARTPQNVWEIPECTTAFPSSGAHCCSFAGCTATTCPNGDEACAPTDCDPRIRVYGDCAPEQCELVMNATAFSLAGACCSPVSGCSLKTAGECSLEPNGTFAGYGTTCADSNLPLACESCRQQGCRQCPLFVDSLEDILNLIVVTGVDIFNIWEGSPPGRIRRNFTEQFLPEPDDSEPPDEPVYTFVIETFQTVYNWVIRLLNRWFGSSLAERDFDVPRRQARVFFRGKGRNTFKFWWDVHFRCDPLTQSSCAYGPQGTGLLPALFVVTSIFGVLLYVLGRIEPVKFTSVLGGVILWFWAAEVFAVAFAQSPFCLLPARWFYVVPAVWPVPAPPVIRNCAPSHFVETFLDPLLQPCWPDCDVAAPWPSPEYYPCAWTLPADLAPSGMLPGVNCNPNITDSCAVLPSGCPTALQRFERLYPQCHAAPFALNSAPRELLLQLRLRLPGLFCVLKNAAGYSLTRPEQWDFAPGGDCGWSTTEEADAALDARWRWCAKNVSNLAFLAQYVLIALLSFLIIAPLAYYLWRLQVSVMDIFSINQARFTAWWSRRYAMTSVKMRSLWFYPFEVVGWDVRKKAKKR